MKAGLTATQEPTAVAATCPRGALTVLASGGGPAGALTQTRPVLGGGEGGSAGWLLGQEAADSLTQGASFSTWVTTPVSVAPAGPVRMAARAPSRAALERVT